MPLAQLPEPTSAHDFRTPDGLRLPLRRYAAHGRTQRVVLLLHGASASSRTFLCPRIAGATDGNGFVDYLRARECEVWTLDWRGSMDVAPHAGNLALTLDGAAEYDIPGALKQIRAVSAHGPLVVVAHCLGAAAFSIAVAGGFIAREDLPRKMVLSTIGLFFQVPWDGWAKAEDQSLERALIAQPHTSFIHCDAEAHPWPKTLEDAFNTWPKRMLPDRTLDRRFHRLTFMFGRPFLEGVVAPQMLAAEELARQFGAMPLAMYIQAGQNVRRGFAAPYDDSAFDFSRSQPRGGGRLDPSSTGKYAHVERFADTQVTLLTGQYNPLWHPDCVRRMHDWLSREPRVRVRRHVVPGYGHQDLFWGKNAAHDVWPLLHAAIR